jgi:hypothetical protein
MPEETSTPRRQQISDSLIERSLGRFGGWQMNTGQTPLSSVEVHGATGAVVSRVKGAALGGLEADVLTWLLAQWVQAGCSEDGVVHTTLYQLAGALYGSRSRGSESKGSDDRRRAANALWNLHMASVTLTDYDLETGMDLPGRLVDLHLVPRIHYGEALQALQNRQDVSPAQLGALRGETLAIYLDEWLLSRLRRDKLRAWLDWPIQRQLGTGIGKRLWLYLEPSPLFRVLRQRPNFEVAVIALTDRVYAELGANCSTRRDNRKRIRRGIERIREIDDRYVLFELTNGEGQEPDQLRVIRRLREVRAAEAPSSPPASGTPAQPRAATAGTGR